MNPTPLDEEVRELAAKVAERLERTGRDKEARLARGFVEGLLHTEGSEQSASQARWTEDERSAWMAARRLLQVVREARPRHGTLDYRRRD